VDYFDGKVVCITGGARGIGFAVARLLGSRGARIAVSDVEEQILEEAGSSLGSEGIEVLVEKADVTSYEDCRRLTEKTLSRFGKLDILVNNAGVSVVSNFEECTAEVIERLYRINLIGQVLMTRAGLDALKESRGQILFMSSVSGIRAIPTGSLYSSSKAALRSFAESIRLELKPYGIHVGVIFPGFTTTDPRKTVMKGDGSPRPIDRPPHDTPEGVAKGVARMLENKERERVLTLMGKLTLLLQRLSPPLLDKYLQNRELKN
jgi:NAD(P)-dependent dehydrogenase (short-subunit alcohol dehydrogenase family)